MTVVHGHFFPQNSLTHQQKTKMKLNSQQRNFQTMMSFTHLYSINILLLNVSSRVERCELRHRSYKSISLCLHTHDSSHMDRITEALETMECDHFIISLAKSNTECCQHWSPANLQHESQNFHICCSIIG